MLTSRRGLLAGGAALVTTGGLRVARAADYPIKPIRLEVGFPPGAITDFSARVMADALTPRLGQPVVVENRPGAESIIAADYVSKSPPDGYTLDWANGDATAMLSAERKTMPYKIDTDFTYISKLVEFSSAIAVNVSRMPGINSLKDFVAYAKANPGKIRYGTTGVGGNTHLVALLLQQQAGIQMTHVPYRGAAQLFTDLLGGFFDMGFVTMTQLGDALTGKVKLLVVTSPVRQSLLPDVETIAEGGYPGATMTDWFGIIGPPRMPPAVVDRLSKAVADAINDPAIRERYMKVGLTPAPVAGEAYHKLVMTEFEKWKVVAKENNIVID